MTPALVLRDLALHFDGVLLFENLQLELAEGDRVAILGASGAGKTTLLRLIAGLLPPTSGEIFLQGQGASKPGQVLIPPAQRGVQMVFQDLGLWPTRTAVAQVSDVMRGHGASVAQAQEKAVDLLQRLGLQDCSHRLPNSLSGGEGRRLAFARALAAEPKLLLLDEPFSGLDPQAREQSLQLLLAALSATGASLVVVSHDPEDARDLAASPRILRRDELGDSLA